MLTEDQLEKDCLSWFREGGWDVVFGPDIAHDGPAPERANYQEVVLRGRLNPRVSCSVDEQQIEGGAA